MRLTIPFSSVGAILISAVALSSILDSQVIVDPGPPRTAPVTKAVEQAPSQEFGLGLAPVVALGGIDESVRDLPSPKRGVARVGIERAISDQVLTRGVWKSTSGGGSVWRLALQSANAVGLRVHFTSFNVSDGQLWVHDVAGRQSFGPYTGRGHFMNGEVWTEVVFSDTIEIEYKPASAAAAQSRTLPFKIQLMHLFRAGGLVTPRSGAPKTTLGTESPFLLGTPALKREPVPAADVTVLASSIPSCFVDAACELGNFDFPEVGLVNGSTAYLLFSDGSGNSYQCSGTMLNARNAAPILLTAGHCINDTATLQSLTAAFGYID